MGKYVNWVDYKGVRMLFLNGRGLREEEYLLALDEMSRELIADRSSPPVLIDLTRTGLTPATATRARELADDMKSQGIPDGPCAVVGLSRLAKGVMQLFGRGARHFDSLEEGQEWLARSTGKPR